jgi:hypothetical protein
VKSTFLTLLSFLLVSVLSAQTGTLSGKVTSASNNEALTGVTIYNAAKKSM